MKIVFEALGFGVGDNLGGSVRVAAQNARGLVSRGHDVTFLCTNLKDRRTKLHKGFHRAKIDGVDVIYLDTHTIPFWPGDFGPHYARVPAEGIPRIEDADVVHLHEYRSFLAARVGLAAISRDVPVVMHPQGTFLRHNTRRSLKFLYDRLWGRRIAAKAARFIACTEVEARAFAENGIEPKRISILPNGCDATMIRHFPPRGEFRRRMGIPADTPVCLSVGRLDPMKGFDLMIRAMAFLPPAAKYVIVGPDQQCLGESLLQLACSLGVGERVIFTGALPRGSDVLAAIADADVLVVPSRYESFGQVILEGALAKRPMVLSSGCNLAGELADRAALMASPEPQALAAACAGLLNDPALATRLGNEAYHLACSRYSIDAVVTALEEIYLRERGAAAKGLQPTPVS